MLSAANSRTGRAVFVTLPSAGRRFDGMLLRSDIFPAEN
jgi:hypothetical protein